MWTNEHWCQDFDKKPDTNENWDFRIPRFLNEIPCSVDNEVLFREQFFTLITVSIVCLSERMGNRLYECEVLDRNSHLVLMELGLAALQIV